ncbi:MAG: MBOAT family protein [Myxococcales bacterium]|jgi:D-alanyl-lipoteichoic acid acyltransferase DltB (MBOAT superfamily)|nr:MBOAT family protein [Myxococcales bacterium]
MYFHSLQFLGFLILALALYWVDVGSKRWRIGILLLTSLTFYAVWSPFPILIFVWCALVDFLTTRGMARFPNRPGLRKALLSISIVSNLGILGTFKYADMFYETATELLGFIGISVRYEPLGLILPIGLSFVAFQAVSLVMDVYRGKLEPKHSFFEHLTYLLFFPAVVAGPIVRAKDLLLHFDETPTLDARAGAEGLFRIATGLVKKLIIADLLATGLVDRVFASPHLYTSAEVFVATLGYSLELYFDFSAYSDIAIGSAALFGFKIPENFDKPYRATNIGAFWNRWHISLSNWLRDYLYFPMGGSRVKFPRMLLNLMVVMTVGGLWHGAGWRFVVWGACHGLFLCVMRVWWKLTTPDGRPPKDIGRLRAFAGWALTFFLVVMARVIFRADDLPAAGALFAQMFEFSGGLANVGTPVWIALSLALVGCFVPHKPWQVCCDTFIRLPVPARAAALVALGLFIRAVGSVEVRPYIYFQF